MLFLEGPIRTCKNYRKIIENTWAYIQLYIYIQSTYKFLVKTGVFIQVQSEIKSHRSMVLYTVQITQHTLKNVSNVKNRYRQKGPVES